MSPQALTFPVTGRRTYAIAQANIGSSAAGGPFLLLFDGVSRTLLADGIARLLITGAVPAAPGYVPTFELLGF